MSKYNINVYLSDIEKLKFQLEKCLFLSKSVKINELDNLDYELKNQSENYKKSYNSISVTIEELKSESYSIFSDLQDMQNEEECSSEEIDNLNQELEIINSKIYEYEVLQERIIDYQGKIISYRKKIDSIKFRLGKICETIFLLSDKATYALQKNIYKVNEYLDVSINNVVSIKTNLHSLDNNFSYIKIRSDENIRLLEKTILSLGDVAVDTLNIIKTQYSEKYESVLRYIESKGSYSLDAVYDLRKYLKDGNIPDSILSGTTLEMNKKIYSSKIKAITEEYRNLSAIRLTKKQMDDFLNTPETILDLVKNYTGKEFREGFQEFFIRLAKNGNQQQIERLWNYSKAHRDIIKNYGIRAENGGFHEWLMCENFGEFLYDSKWRRDGAFLAVLITKLVQKTNDVYMENVTIWNRYDECYDEVEIWNHYREAQETRGSINNPDSLIHNTIRKCIAESNTAAELLVKLEQNIKATFSEYTYKIFNSILQECLK